MLSNVTDIYSVYKSYGNLQYFSKLRTFTLLTKVTNIYSVSKVTDIDSVIQSYAHLQCFPKLRAFIVFSINCIETKISHLVHMVHIWTNLHQVCSLSKYGKAIYFWNFWQIFSTIFLFFKHDEINLTLQRDIAPLVEQELPTLLEYMCSLPFLVGFVLVDLTFSV